MFNLAERWGVRSDNTNPVRHVGKYAESKKERYLTADEFLRLAKALSEAEGQGTENPFVIAAIRLLILTGARLGEVLSLRWSDVNFEHGILLLGDSKTGRKTIFLSKPAMDLLNELPRVSANPYVIVGARSRQHLKNLQKPWGRMRRAAKLSDVRIHDLRHSFASIAAASGMSLPVIGKLLGHTKSATTERYSHLAADPLKAANEAIGQQLAKLLGSEKRSDAVP
jgi:integrase